MIWKISILYCLFTLGKACSSLRMIGEQSFLKVDRPYNMASEGFYFIPNMHTLLLTCWSYQPSVLETATIFHQINAPNLINTPPTLSGGIFPENRTTGQD